jgi:hypothetical protein
MLAFQNKRYFEELFDISSALYALENKARSETGVTARSEAADVPAADAPGRSRKHGEGFA